MRAGTPIAERWRKKPVVVEAEQLDGTHDGMHSVIEWINSHNPRFDPANSLTWTASAYYGQLKILTLEGEMTAHKGDWIIKGVKGEFYPCKPDIFAATYEPEGTLSASEERERVLNHRLDSMAHEPFNTPEELMQDLIRENSEFTKTIVRLRERERVLREALDKVKPTLTDKRLDELLTEYESFTPVRMRVYDALTELKQYRLAVRAALAIPAPEQPSICPDCRSAKPSSRGLLCDAGREWRCDNEWHEQPAQTSAEKAGIK